MKTQKSYFAAAGVLINDTDLENNSLNANVVNPPLHGTLFLNTDGGFTYTPATNFVGTDSFTYRVCDNGSLCDTGTVTFEVQGTPVLGIAKAVAAPVLQNDGTYNLFFTITVKNMGRLDLSDLQVSDDLSKAFPAPLTVKILPTRSLWFMDAV